MPGSGHAFHCAGAQARLRCHAGPETRICHRLLRVRRRGLVRQLLGVGPVEKVVPVNFYIPGCPPRPEAIIYGVAVALGLVDKKVAPVTFKQMQFPIPQYHPRDLRRDRDMVVYEKVEKV